MQIKSIKLMFPFIILLAAIAPVSSDLYLPSLPTIANNFHVDISLVQLSLAIFILGVSIARLFIGVVSDAFGRKAPLIMSLVLCFIGSFLCFKASGIPSLFVGRFLQGFGAGGSNIIARVILRDRSEGTKLAEYNSYYSMGGIALMAVAPLAGGYLYHYFGWRSTFFVLTILALINLFISIFIIPETNEYRHKDNLKPSVFKRNLQSLLTSPTFLMYAILLAFGYGCMAAWLTAAPVILQKILGFSAIDFGWLAGLVGSCYFLGAFFNGRLVKWFGVNKMLGFGISTVFIASLFMLALGLLNYVNGVAYMAPVMLAIFGVSFIIANSFAAGLNPFGKIAGIAAALLGSIQILGGVLTSSYISIVPDYNQLPVGSVFFVCGLLGIFMVRFVRKVKCKKT